MFLSKSFVALLTLTLAVAANPIVKRNNIVTIPFAKRINMTGSANLVQLDQARAKAIKDREENRRSGRFTAAGGGSQPLTATPVSYVASVGVGSPPTFYDLIVDTGSSNTWIGADKSYNPTSTSIMTANTVFVSYGSGEFFGEEYLDQVVLGELVITKQSIGVAEIAIGFDGVDGILGIGPVGLTVGTLDPDDTQPIPTVTDNLFPQGSIPENLVAVSFAPLTTAPETNGELTFGGIDSSKFTGSIHFTPITTTFSASEFWGVDQTISYGGTTILPSTAGIVDTGTTLVLIATDAYKAYQEATGATFDDQAGLLKITQAQYDNLKDLDFVIGGETYTLTPNAQIWPRALNTAIGGDAGSIYLVVGDLKSNSGEGLDFIDGQSFLERFYSVYDTENGRVGLATTPFTFATTN